MTPDNLIVNFNRENKSETESWNVSKLLEYLRVEIEIGELTLSFRRQELDDEILTVATLNANIENKYIFCSMNRDIESFLKT